MFKTMDFFQDFPCVLRSKLLILDMGHPIFNKESV